MFALVALAVASCTASGEASDRATVVLFDVSNSTRTEHPRALRRDVRLGEHLREDGGVLGADVVDANPLVHGELPINETFEPCTITDNSLTAARARGAGAARASLVCSDPADSSRGTDVFGALTLAEQFFQAYPDASGRTLVLLSDMVQSANGMHLGAVEAWTEADVSALLADAPSADLTGVRVYVVGAGATTLAEMTPAQIEGIQLFLDPLVRTDGRARRVLRREPRPLPHRDGGRVVNIGEPKKTIEIEPVTVPVPQEVPLEEPVEAPEPAAVPDPVEEPARGVHG
jgi:hypothetical protein